MIPYIGYILAELLYCDQKLLELPSRHDVAMISIMSEAIATPQGRPYCDR